MTKMKFSFEEFIFKFQIILVKFLVSVQNQSFNLCLIVFLFVKSQNTFAILLFLIEFLSGAFTVWQKYLTENKITGINGINEICGTNRIWSKKILFLWCHPFNVVAWPLIVVHNPSETNRKQLKV